MEQYRDYIDGLLAAAGIDWKDLTNILTGGSKALDQLATWARANPQDPRAQLFSKNPSGFRDNLIFAVRRLSNPSAHGDRGADEQIAQAIGFGLDAAPQKPDGSQGSAEPAGPTQAQQETDTINKYIDDLVNELRAPVVDPVTGAAKDSIYDTLLKGGATAGLTSATMRGVGGPLAGANAMDSAQSAALPYLMQRQNLLQNALGLQSNRNMGLEQLRQGAAGLDLQRQQFNNQVATNQWAAEQNQQQGILGAIGGVGGAVVGGIAGGPAGVIPGAKAGSGILAGLGSAASPGPSIQPITPYKSGIL